MKNFLLSRRQSITVALSGLASILLVSGMVYATTIGTDVNTGGALTVSGVSTLTGLSTLTGGFVSQASSTAVAAFNVDGAATLRGTLGVTGLSTLTGGVVTGLASSTSLLVGSEPNQTVSGIMFGFCTIADVSVAVASSTVQTTCAGATNMTTSYRVFVQATSSMPRQIVIQSATSSTGAIEVRLFNPAGGLGTPAAAPVSINYWAIK